MRNLSFVSLSSTSTMSTSQLRASKKSQTLAQPTLDRSITNVLVSFPSFNNLALDIMNVAGQCDTMNVGGVSWKKFEDGFPNLMIHNVENFRSRDVVFLADFLHLEALFPQLAGSSFFLTLPNMTIVFLFTLWLSFKCEVIFFLYTIV
jgi:hypothetical protein